jgi:hypothetical protein
MAEEGSDLPHAHLLASCGAEPARLEEGGGGDEGLVVPEAGGVGLGIVAVGEELLELVRPEVVADGLVAAEPAAAALPPLVAHLLAGLLLPPRRRRRRRYGKQKQKQCRPSGHRGCRCLLPSQRSNSLAAEEKRGADDSGEWGRKRVWSSGMLVAEDAEGGEAVSCFRFGGIIVNSYLSVFEITFHSCTLNFKISQRSTCLVFEYNSI